jgi:hypothetical protein
MKRQMFFATVFATALAVSAAAQQPPTGAQPPAQERASSQQVTFSGCLQPATPSGATGTTGAPGTPSSSQEFVLANASPAGSATGTAGTSGMPSSAGSSMGNKYRLVGGDKEDLQKYLNSQVEIRGTLDKSSAAAAAGAATGAGKSDDLPTLRVISIKQIASTCASGK